MMVASLMQPLIVLYIWLVIQTFRVMPKCMRCVLHRRPEHEEPSSASVKEKLCRHMSIAKSILVDFQEAQSFFVICIQAAVLVAFAGDSIILGAFSLSQLQANYLVATWISAVVIISVTFGLWILHRSNLDSTYIYVWSVASIILSGVTFFYKSSQEPNLSSINLDESNIRRLDKCGHHPPPLIYCVNHSYMSLESRDNMRAVIVACFTICGVLGLQKITHCLPSELSFFATFSRLSNAIEPVSLPG